MFTISTVIWFAGGFSVGVVVAAALSANRIRRLQEDATLHKTATEELMLLRARVRAVQDKGKPMGKDVVYNIQQPNGRYGKFTLPRV
jgi:hypothetical protein